MTSYLIEIEVHGSGALWDGTASQVVDQWLSDTTDTIASKGLSEIQFWMDRFFKNPTPYYETQMVVDRTGDDRVIHDRGIIYGPWLAGTSSRNVSTRFKGYTHWRRTVQYLEQEMSPAFLERERAELVRRLAS